MRIAASTAITLRCRAVRSCFDNSRQQLERTSERFREFDLVLYEAGADVHVDDPLGGVLNSEQMRQRDRIVFEAPKDPLFR